ncbi:MAG: MXAN_6640 family putative metalloprotease [Bacteroidota bacterium]
MKLITVVFIGLLSIRFGYAQTGTSARQDFLRRELAGMTGDASLSSAQDAKCGTSLLALAYAHGRNLSPVAKTEMVRLLQRPLRQTSKVSPSGRFRIHYDTTGFQAPAMISTTGSPQRIPGSHEQYVDSVAATFDHCWEVQVTDLGYQSPPTDGGQGGGEEYDIYIGNLGTGEFGSTSWLASDLLPGGPSERYLTFIEIDNDYLGHRTSGLNGLKVTAAHEFHHAVQIGSYGIWSSSENYDFYFYELSAVWMEDVLFPDINDYLFDVPTYFQRFRESQTQRSLRFTTYAFPSFFGYERSIFAHFLAKRFGPEVMRTIWSGIRNAPALQSVNEALQREGTDLATEFALFSFWNYFTADRADTVRYYPEGNRYPRYVPNVSTSYGGSSSTISGSAYALSSQFYQFTLPGDTITALATNIEIAAAGTTDANPRAFDLMLSSRKTMLPSQTLSKGVIGGFSGDPKAWRLLYMESSSRRNANAAPQISPNPVRLREATRLTIPLAGATGAEAEVFFLSASFDLVFSRRYPAVDVFGNKVVYVPAGDLQQQVSSGVYFVYARCGNEEFRWKVAILQ